MTDGSVKYKVPFIRPSFPSAQELADDYKKIVASNWYTNFGPYERKFAKSIAEYIGVGYHAVTFNNAMTALIAGIDSILGHGDNSRYVIMPSFTFVAGAAALEWCGYKPLFIDIEPEGLQMDITAAKAALQKHGDQIAGILFCNAFGVGALNIDDWEDLAKQNNLPLIIDSAAGFGSVYRGDTKVGSAGTCEIFSFHATKAFAIGEGGALVTRDGDLAKRLEQTENFGFDERNAKRLGFNGKLQEINAAIGLHQLDRIDPVLKKRRAVFDEYRTRLDSKRYSFQANTQNAALCFTSVIASDQAQRDKKLEELLAVGVEAKTYYNPPIHRQTYYKDSESMGRLPVSDDVCSRILSLPTYDSLTKADIDLIINTLS